MSRKTVDGLVKDVSEAILSRKPLPAMKAELTLEDAYEVQHRVTAQVCPEGSGGLKAGVTASGAQAFFGLEHALIASLYPKGGLTTGASLPFAEGRNIECEIAVLVDKEGEPKALAPAIEFVTVAFSRPEDLNAANLTVGNLGAEFHLVGAFKSWSLASENLKAELTFNGNIVNDAQMSDALGGPIHAVPWMWAEARKRGFSFDGDTVFMTGACGAVIPAAPGAYKADYGVLGSVDFSIE